MLRGHLRQGVVLGAVCAVLLATSFAGSAEGIGISSSKCRPVGSKTLLRDAHTRVYTLPTRGQEAERDPESVRIFGCLFGPGRSYLLGTTFRGFINGSPGRIDPEKVVVATPFAAYSTSSTGIDFNVVRVVVRNLRTGATYIVPYPVPPFTVEQLSWIADIVVTPSGSVAWIGEGRFVAGGEARAAVGLAGLGQPATILEEGPGIDPESLQLDGNQLTWLNEGVLHSAEMP